MINLGSYPAMSKPSKQIVIDEIVAGIESGKSRGELLATIGEKWQLPPRTFDRYLKTASEQHTAKQEAIKKELTAVDIEAAIEARKSGLKSKVEKQEHLQKLIEDIENDIKNDDQLTSQAKGYLRKTIKDLYSELNKMDGDYAPIKQEVKHELPPAVAVVPVGEYLPLSRNENEIDV